jgi:hypothetical protein
MPKDSVTESDASSVISEQEVTPASGGDDKNISSNDSADENKTGSDVEQWKQKAAEAADQVQKLQQDINQLKSSRDQRDNKQIDELTSLKEQVKQLLTKDMNETELLKFNQGELSKQIDALKSEREQAKTALDSTKRFYAYRDMFITQYGVSPDKLKMDGTADELFTSGMLAVKEQMDNLKAAKTEPETDNEPVGEDKKKSPPNTAKFSGKDGGNGTLTLKELAKKYADGDVEKFFQMTLVDPKMRQLLNDAAKGIDNK